MVFEIYLIELVSKTLCNKFSLIRTTANKITPITVFKYVKNFQIKGQKFLIPRSQ